jgi:heme-degrading monooxygenase HmoA
MKPFSYIKQGVDSMVFVVVQHIVEDFGKWKAVYEAHTEKRKAAGMTNAHQVIQGLENPNQVCIVLEWDSPENLKTFMESDEMKQTMKEAGVTGESSVMVGNKV